MGIARVRPAQTVSSGHVRVRALRGERWRTGGDEDDAWGVDVSSKRRWDARDDDGGEGDGEEEEAEARERGRGGETRGGDAEETGGRDDESTELGDGDDDESGGVLIGDARRVESSRVVWRLGRVFERRGNCSTTVFMYSNSFILSFFNERSSFIARCFRRSIDHEETQTTVRLPHRGDRR